MSTRHQIRHAVTSILFTAGAIAWAPGAMAAGNAPEHALKASAEISDAELPAIAKKGSGTSGDFNPAAFGAAEVEISLADGRVLKAKRQRVEEDKTKGRKSWVGTFPEQPGSIVVMTTSRGVTTGFVTHGNETWEIMPGKAGKHLLYRVDDSKLPTAEPVLFADTGSSASLGDYGTGGAATDAAGGYVHDLLVVYTPAAKNAYGQATLESMAQNAVVAANQAYLNSGIAITLNLVGLQEISYTESGAMQTSLYDLQGTSDGKMDSVHQLRNSVGADVVTLLSQDGDACGIAWAMRTVSTSFAATAFNVVKPSCLSQHTMAHEIGHNQGNMHDRASTSNTGAYSYSYGFRRCMTDGTGFRTVMSYSCSGANRVAWFSNPSANYNGYATGIAYESDPANSADNARSMNNTAATVAAFRGASGGSGGTAPAAPSTLSASAASDTSVTVRWSDNSSDETGFRLERSLNGVDYSEIVALGASAASFVDNGLVARTTYYYRVRAYNSVGNSAYSNVGSVTTSGVAPPPPVAPSSVTAANNANGSATVSWADASVNETGFEIRREQWDSSGSYWKSATSVGSVASGMTSIVDVTNSGTFRYSVRAVNSGGSSSFAGPAAVTVTGGRTKGKSGK